MSFQLPNGFNNHVADLPWWQEVLRTYLDPLNVWIGAAVMIGALLIRFVMRGHAGPLPWWARLGSAVVIGLGTAGYVKFVERPASFEWSDVREAVLGALAVVALWP